MKFLKNIFLLASGALMLGFAACSPQPEVRDSDAIMLGEESVTLPAREGEKTVTIYADGKWMASVTDEWLTIEPESGEGTMDITIRYEANNSDLERESAVYVRGSEFAGEKQMTILQKMDRFRELEPVTIADVLAKNEGDLAKVTDCQIMAVAKDAFVVSDATGNLLVSGKTSLKAGDKITLTGDVAKVNNILGVVMDEEIFLSSAELVYPEPKDVTGDASYKPGVVEYVSLTASYKTGGNLAVDGKNVAILYKPLEDYSSLLKRDVEFVGYYVGISSKLGALIAISYEDRGETPVVGFPIPYEDDFSWVEPLVQWDLDNGRTQGNSIEKKATVNYGNAYAIPDFEAEFTGARGYESMFYSSKTVYVCQGNYLKFSKTNNCNGLRLPPFALEGPTDVLLSFDWAKNGSDNVVLVIEIEGKGTVDGGSVSSEMSVDDGFTWKTESVKISGIDGTSRICIRPTTYTGAVHSDGSLYRWFIDNLKVISLEGMVEAKVEVGGLEKGFIAFEGLEPQPVSFTVKSDADFALSTSVSWLHLDVTEGLAKEETTVTLTCDPSELSTLRQSEVTIRSGLTTTTIPVIQSASGQLLDPLISVISSKPTDGLLGEGDSFSVSLQSNVPYEIAISEDRIKAVAPVAPRAAVEKTEHSFTLDPNVSGATRTGYVRFFNEDNNVEAVVVVKQANFEPRIDVIYNHQIGYIPAAGMSFDAHLSSNLDFTVTAENASSSVEAAAAGEHEAKITVPANGGASRDVKLVFYSEKYDYTKVVSISQLGNDVLFADNFDWLEPLIANYNEKSGKKIGDAMGEQNFSSNAPNPYSDANLKNDFPAALAAAGYTDLNASAKVLYPQANYMKHCKTDNETSLQFSPCTALESASNIVLDFDWFAHAKAGFIIDPVNLVAVIEGDGTFENGTKYSDVQKNQQVDGEFHWVHAKLNIVGATKDTKLNIVPDVCIKEDGSYNWKVKGVYRYYLDNIVVRTR